MKTRTFNVTQKHIDEANKARADYFQVPCNLCPVGIAIYKTLKKGQMYVSVCPDGSNALMLGNKIMKAPPSVIDFVARFDSREPVEPFSFELEY